MILFKKSLWVVSVQQHSTHQVAFPVEIQGILACQMVVASVSLVAASAEQEAAVVVTLVVVSVVAQAETVEQAVQSAGLRVSKDKGQHFEIEIQ